MGVRRHRRHCFHFRFCHRFLITALTFLLFASQISGKERVTSLDRVFAVQKRLAGPGSSPPACRSKCGRCSPCKPVHVPIQPGLSIPLEYYPEAWRCKCGNKLFMP
ncbi:EPIDERMAL PATTERNING FACTOR-like protein 4 [Morus notabilis]|uniref:EPIDERMAL PATTERNING FACTOR-like protein 4 n=1 Tax=Morus notabilis TaxID=981085 RepID=UPI000CED5752|nr:EPIDERMAL PATTERNING FACTOR-like protein 4 [Morus notabilis]XP_024018789.1 EPIDERMAL PATTERNING FACTOR-like protein 4 [Morus notabilis]